MIQNHSDHFTHLYVRQLHWSPFLKSVDVPQLKSSVLSLTVVPKSTMNAPSPVVITSKSVAVETGAGIVDVITVEEPVLVLEKKAYDLMDDLLEADVLKLYRQVLAEEYTQVTTDGNCMPLSAAEKHAVAGYVRWQQTQGNQQVTTRGPDQRNTARSGRLHGAAR
jgi:hypothetical protein